MDHHSPVPVQSPVLDCRACCLVGAVCLLGGAGSGGLPGLAQPELPTKPRNPEDRVAAAERDAAVRRRLTQEALDLLEVCSFGCLRARTGPSCSAVRGTRTKLKVTGPPPC